ncbi:hypothetical protein AGLY_004923 [Aphis glycines]|uniref:Uncharacterized protein n=1 Tax=Aphis glycines TaxID=307491 RepID=A0A6G0TVE4_APHGL|nr:hypothetical protein AGLY_004923 [Aphis glycines]
MILLNRKSIHRSLLCWFCWNIKNTLTALREFSKVEPEPWQICGGIVDRETNRLTLKELHLNITLEITKVHFHNPFPPIGFPLHYVLCPMRNSVQLKPKIYQKLPDQFLLFYNSSRVQYFLSLEAFYNDFLLVMEVLENYYHLLKEIHLLLSKFEAFFLLHGEKNNLRNIETCIIEVWYIWHASGSASSTLLKGPVVLYKLFVLHVSLPMHLAPQLDKSSCSMLSFFNTHCICIGFYPYQWMYCFLLNNHFVTMNSIVNMNFSLNLVLVHQPSDSLKYYNMIRKQINAYKNIRLK